MSRPPYPAVSFQKTYSGDSQRYNDVRLLTQTLDKSYCPTSFCNLQGIEYGMYCTQTNAEKTFVKHVFNIKIYILFTIYLQLMR